MTQPRHKEAEPAATRRFVLPNGFEVAYQSRAEVEFFYNDIFEKQIYVKHGIELVDGDLVFDVGANIGLFTLFVQQHYRNIKVYAFEPAPPLFEILRYNVARYASNVTLFNCGLSNEEKVMPFTFYPNSSGMSSFYAQVDEEREALRGIMANQFRQGMPGMEHVMRHADELLNERLKSETSNCRLRTVSQIIDEAKLDHIDLMKIDVQKSELDVVNGIAPDDWPRIRQIVIEVHDFNGRLRYLTDLLEMKGYQVDVEQDDHYRNSILYNVFAKRIATSAPTPIKALSAESLRQIHNRAKKQQEAGSRRRQLLGARNKTS